jgi:hypothetical protein
MAVRSIAINKFSWTSYSPTERVYDSVVGDLVTFFGLQNLPDFPSSSGDTNYTVKLNDKIEQLAYTFYGNVELWWVLAGANDIVLPDGDMYEGLVLRIPAPSVVNQVLGIK